MIGSDRAAAATGVVLSLRWAWFFVDVAVGVEMSAANADVAAVGELTDGDEVEARVAVGDRGEHDPRV